jgi:hypothetical protein
MDQTVARGRRVRRECVGTLEYSVGQETVGAGGGEIDPNVPNDSIEWYTRKEQHPPRGKGPLPPILPHNGGASERLIDLWWC